ncbi:uncharacterized protein LOC132066074 [Lycium ferocissimum]|uniref:uncharacterized protein LOC132066074 n=1 Tax=Lycium ferocissimum TaxID=112874 RepID=UPI002816321D|nr:uncharacterized protein LOC132066074 [Lycium ferocissimum]
MARTTISIKWEPPELTPYKLNSDRACQGNSGVRGIRGVIRDRSGNWVLGYMKRLPHTTNNLVELTAIMQGLKLAMEHNLMPLEINTDSTEVIKMINEGHLSYNSIISDCRCLMRKLAHPVLKHSYREQNKVADLSAEEGGKQHLFEGMEILAVPPMFVRKVFWADRVETVYDRNVNFLCCNTHKGANSGQPNGSNAINSNVVSVDIG